MTLIEWSNWTSVHRKLKITDFPWDRDAEGTDSGNGLQSEGEVKLS